MADIVTVVGAISGAISLVGIVYMLGYWKGQVDSKLRDMQQMMTAYPPAELSLMTKTLWDIYVIDALRARPDLAEPHSAFHLKKEGHDLIPDDLKKALDRISINPDNRNAVASGWLVVKHLGMSPISQMAEQQKLSVQEAIAILSCYLDERTSATQPS